MAARFGETSVIEEVLQSDPGMEEVFRSLGLKCVDCVATAKETLRTAAQYHGIVLDRILAAVNEPRR